jgi:hypothetical protein
MYFPSFFPSVLPSSGLVVPLLFPSPLTFSMCTMERSVQSLPPKPSQLAAAVRLINRCDRLNNALPIFLCPFRFL